MEKFKHLVSALLPSVMIVTVCLSFVLSLVSLAKSISNEKTIADVQSTLTELTSNIDSRLQSIDAHIGVIEKYASANYEWFYGDATTTNNGFIVIDKSNSKSKKK